MIKPFVERSLYEKIVKNRLIFTKKVYTKIVCLGVLIRLATNLAIKQSNYIDPSTGEVFYTKEERLRLQFNEKGYLFRKDKNGFRNFSDYPLPDCFSWSERGRIDALKYQIAGDDQLLVHRVGGRIHPIGAPEIAKILKMSERQCKELLAKMIKHKVVKECILDGRTFYMFNPLYACRGRRITFTVYVVFQDELNKVLPAWVINKFLEQAKEIPDSCKPLQVLPAQRKRKQENT